MLEYRHTEAQIHFDNRMEFGQPFFILIDRLWEAINLRNGSVPIREGAYIFGIPLFNEDVIREVANNAFTHRNYLVNSEIIIKQYPTKLTVVNAGGFPKGVTIDNSSLNLLALSKNIRYFCMEARRRGLKRKNPDSSPAYKSGRGTTGTARQKYEKNHL